MRQRLALALVLLAAALTALLLWGVQDTHTLRLEAPAAVESARQQVAGVSATTVATGTVTESPQFSGEDAKGRHWQLNAHQATQSGTLSDSMVVLDQAKGWWQGDGGRFTGEADEGHYRPGDQQLNLKGNVVLQSSDTIIHTPALRADLATQEVSGTSGVSLTHALPTQLLKVQAEQFAVDPKTKTVTLRGQVRARLEPK